MGIFVLVTSAMGNKCYLYPISNFKLLFNVSIMCVVLCRCVYSQKDKMPFNNISSTYSPLSPPQYPMIPKTTKSCIYFLFSSEFILPQYYSKSSSNACSSPPKKPKFFLLMLSVCFFFPLMNISNHVHLVGWLLPPYFYLRFTEYPNQVLGIQQPKYYHILMSSSS